VCMAPVCSLAFARAHTCFLFVLMHCCGSMGQTNEDKIVCVCACVFRGFGCTHFDAANSHSLTLKLCMLMQKNVYTGTHLHVHVQTCWRANSHTQLMRTHIHTAAELVSKHDVKHGINVCMYISFSWRTLCYVYVCSSLFDMNVCLFIEMTWLEARCQT
jgi:hypothetical protein